MSLSLSGFEKDDQPTLKLTVNKEFAKHYDKSRRSEELMKLKARYGDVNLADEEDTDSESEDEDAEELTAAVEQKWLKTLAALKSNDPRIYDDKTKFFDSADEESTETSKQLKKRKKKRDKKLTLKDMDRKVITEREGKYSDNSSDSEGERSKPQDKSYYEEQDEIRNSILRAHKDLSSNEDDEDELLTVKVKTAAQKEAEEEEYRKFIKGQHADVDEEAAKDLTGLRDYWNRDGMTEADKFLKDYILEKKYRVEESENESSDSEDDDDRQRFQMLSEDDEDEVAKADQFELKYNFRFEEPDPDFIKSYPRTVNTTMRQEKNRRKEKRANVQERKDKEKQKRREELNRLRNLKQQEIEDKLKSIMKKSGAENMPFTGEELEEDFNPDEHDKKMKEMFPEDEDEEGELVKPTFEFDSDIDDYEDWDKFHVKAGEGTSAIANSGNVEDEELLDPEDPNFVMDADYDPNAATLEDRNFGLDGKSKRHKRKKNRLRKALDKKKPLFNPDDKSFEEYLDEYYGLECEDMVGDLKCRFPYREVPANDYGLSVGEILSARDKELNSWSSLKKTVQYRTNEEEYKDISKFRRKSHDVNKKKRLLPSLFKDAEQTIEEEEEGPEDVEMADEVHVTEEQSNDANMETEQDNDEEMEVKSSAKSKQVSSKSSAGNDSSNISNSSRKRKGKWKGKQKVESKSEQSSRGMSFKRMEAYGMHSEVKRVKKLRARDKRRN